MKSYYSELDKQILLEGKVVIVTGSTSGLGKGIAEQLYKVHFWITELFLSHFSVAWCNSCSRFSITV